MPHNPTTAAGTALHERGTGRAKVAIETALNGSDAFAHRALVRHYFSFSFSSN
jgi:hypothetical protein